MSKKDNLDVPNASKNSKANIPASAVSETPKLKLNTKRTVYIGMAFFTIMMLWQVYNTYCPLFLSDFLSKSKAFSLTSISSNS